MYAGGLGGGAVAERRDDNGQERSVAIRVREGARVGEGKEEGGGNREFASEGGERGGRGRRLGGGGVDHGRGGGGNHYRPITKDVDESLDLMNEV
ncbi:hypothetical protein OsI_15401 [Oryza sativa Indica Group]|uniref:Uncharacterized protein n=1 Tax=Oryza sativa subsp. indica TaxID=39946 RepID=A2XS07_ORYSI|nr:hypothetical protein OsI_15401 [Oryza sativa Indica Group]